MSAQSASRTMHITNLRTGILYDYRRTSNLVSISSIKAGTADFETMECAALSIIPSPHSSGLNDRDMVCGCLFEIPQDDLGPYIEREHRYAVEKINVYDVNLNDMCEALTVVAQTDEAYSASMDNHEYHQRVGQFYEGALWSRTDILPLRTYTNNAILAAYELGGDEWLRNFVDGTLLSDGSTTIRGYFQRYPERMFVEVKKLLDIDL